MQQIKAYEKYKKKQQQLQQLKDDRDTKQEELKDYLDYAKYNENTYNTNRETIKGGFFETFRDPLFIVEQTREGANKPSVYFYKPFYDEDKRLLNLFGIGLKNNELEFKTYYLDKSGSRMREMLNNKVKILYVKE